MVSGESFLGIAFIACFMAACFIFFMVTKVRQDSLVLKIADNEHSLLEGYLSRRH